MHFIQDIWRSLQGRATIGLTAAVVGLAATAPSTAALAAAVSQPAQPPAQASGERFKSEIALLDRYVTTDVDGTLSLSPPAQVASHVDAGDMAVLKAGLATTNQKIKSGELVVAGNHRLVDPKATAFNIQWNWTFQAYYWWGVQYWFSEYWTLKIEGAVTMGAAVATICGIIAAALGAEPIALLCGLAAAVLAFGVGWMMWADNGGGVVFSQTYTPFPLGGIWISGQ